MEHMRCRKDGNTCACIPWTTRVKRKKEAKMRRGRRKKKKGTMFVGSTHGNSGVLSVFLGYGCPESDHTGK